MTDVNVTLNRLPEKAMIEIIHEVGKNHGLVFQQGANFQAHNVAGNPPTQVFNGVVLVCNTKDGIAAIGGLLHRISELSP
jgi:hypothetical protein